MTDTTPATAWLQLPTDALVRLPTVLAEIRSPVEAAMLQREIGFALGASFGDAFDAWIGEASDTTADEYWTALSRFFEQAGWGRLRFEQLAEGVGSLRAEPWVDADGHVSTGILADILSRAAGSDVAVMETPADAAREAGGCRFVFGSQEAMQALYEHLHETGSLGEAIERLA
jgi:hypothetical protein